MMRIAVAAAIALLLGQAWADSPPRIAIIIDDLGYQLDAGRRAIALPGPVSYAILPGAPQSRSLAESAHARAREVLLHLPLQAVDYDGPDEPAGITLDMSRVEFAATFAQAISSVPFVIGVSSHRGSLLTRHPGHMAWLMQEIGSRENLFFVDSYTTPASVALTMAREAGVAARKRDVFLDHDKTSASILREFERLKTIAAHYGSAIGIGHPYPITLEFLERELPQLAKEGIELVAISELIKPSAGIDNSGAIAAGHGAASR